MPWHSSDFITAAQRNRSAPTLAQNMYMELGTNKRRFEKLFKYIVITNANESYSKFLQIYNFMVSARNCIKPQKSPITVGSHRSPFKCSYQLLIETVSRATKKLSSLLLIEWSTRAPIIDQVNPSNHHPFNDQDGWFCGKAMGVPNVRCVQSILNRLHYQLGQI